MKVTNIGDGLDHYDTLIREGADRSQIARRKKEAVSCEGMGVWSPVNRCLEIDDRWQYALIDERTDYDIMREALESISNDYDLDLARCARLATDALESLTGDSGCDEGLRQAVRAAINLLGKPESNRAVVRMHLQEAMEDE